MAEKVSKSLIFKERLDSPLDSAIQSFLAQMTLEKVGERIIATHQLSNVAGIAPANFPVNFQGVIPGARRDAIFSYQDSYPIRCVEDPRRPGFGLPVEFEIKIRKVDVVTFIAKQKDGSFEFRAYQIGRRHE